MFLKTTEIAQRIKAFRKELGLTRRDFSAKFNIAEPTLTSWELGLVKSIQMKNIETLVNNINAQGFQINKEAFVYEQGFLPTSQAYFKNVKEILHKVTNNVNAPILERDDMLVGKQTLLPFKKLYNKLCIVQSDQQYVGVVGSDKKGDPLLNTLFGKAFMTLQNKKETLFFVVSHFMKR